MSSIQDSGSNAIEMQNLVNADLGANTKTNSSENVSKTPSSFSAAPVSSTSSETTSKVSRAFTSHTNSLEPNPEASELSDRVENLTDQIPGSPKLDENTTQNDIKVIKHELDQLREAKDEINTIKKTGPSVKKEMLILAAVVAIVAVVIIASIFVPGVLPLLMLGGLLIAGVAMSYAQASIETKSSSQKALLEPHEKVVNDLEKKYYDERARANSDKSKDQRLSLEDFLNNKIKEEQDRSELEAGDRIAGENKQKENENKLNPESHFSSSSIQEQEDEAPPLEVNRSTRSPAANDIDPFPSGQLFGGGRVITAEEATQAQLDGIDNAATDANIDISSLVADIDENTVRFEQPPQSSASSQNETENPKGLPDPPDPDWFESGSPARTASAPPAFEAEPTPTSQDVPETEDPDWFVKTAKKAPSASENLQGAEVLDEASENLDELQELSEPKDSQPVEPYDDDFPPRSVEASEIQRPASAPPEYTNIKRIKPKKK